MISISIYSIISFCIIFFGYIIQSTLLLFYYYYLNGNKKKEWKIQSSIGSMGMYSIPLLSNKKDRGPYHKIITTFNLIMASIFALITTEFTLHGYTNIKFTEPKEYGLYYMLQDIVIAILYQSIIEYYWHRIMHWKIFYKYMHKYHHYYKSPEVYDDLYIHPLESFGLSSSLLNLYY